MHRNVFNKLIFYEYANQTPPPFLDLLCILEPDFKNLSLFGTKRANRKEKKFF